MATFYLYNPPPIGAKAFFMKKKTPTGTLMAIPVQGASPPAPPTDLRGQIFPKPQYPTTGS